MDIELLTDVFCICKYRSTPDLGACAPFLFYAVTDREISLVCKEGDQPDNADAISGGWRAMRIVGTLDFALTGILARIADVLAKQEIPIFAISTYDTDYILVGGDALDRAASALNSAGYRIVRAFLDNHGS